MKKNKIFIGSSVEGLKIAYAVQQNLRHTAETTVWDQGVFDLSSTTIESLIKVLDNSDFGIFVFSPDDIIKFRGNEALTVRDNVVFELGLFIGRLGRERSFILIPEGAEIKLPTDLLGITPGNYEVNRSDNSDQAATGAASHQIRLQIERLGSRKNDSVITDPDSFEESKKNNLKQKNKKNDWLDLYIDGEYEKSVKEIEKNIDKEKSKKEILNLELWKANIIWRINSQDSIIHFNNLIKNNIKNPIPYIDYLNLLLNNDILVDVMKIIEEGIKNTTGKEDEFICLKSKYFTKIGEIEDSIKILSNALKNKPSEKLYLELIKVVDDTQKSHEIIHKAYKSFPTSEKIIEKYARIVDELNLNNEALFLRKKLINIDKSYPLYFGLLGNTYLDLDLYNQAYESYEKANKLADYKTVLDYRKHWEYLQKCKFSFKSNRLFTKSNRNRSKI